MVTKLLRWLLYRNKPNYGKRILIIDPDQYISHLITDCLTDTGIEFQISRVIRPIKPYRGTFDLVFINEPNFILVKDFRLSSAIYESPVIIAGYGQWHDEPIKLAFNLIQQDAQEFFSPPYNSSKLLSVIEKYFNAPIPYP